MRRDSVLLMRPVILRKNILASWINPRFENVLQHVFSVDLDPMGSKKPILRHFWKTLSFTMTVGGWCGPENSE